jgi:hypothetical protein
VSGRGISTSRLATGSLCKPKLLLQNLHLLCTKIQTKIQSNCFSLLIPNSVPNNLSKILTVSDELIWAGISMFMVNRKGHNNGGKLQFFFFAKGKASVVSLTIFMFTCIHRPLPYV